MHDAALGEQTSDVTQSPTDIEPATVTVKFEGAEQDSALMWPASARLDLDVDGHVEFSAYAKASDEAFYLRLTIPSQDEPLQGQAFELEPGAGQPNEISLMQGELPNATAWRSVSGTAQFETFGKDAFELTFDAELSRDPRRATATTKVTGNFRGGALFVCQGVAVRSDQGSAHANNGRGQAIASAPDDECRARLAKLVSD